MTRVFALPRGPPSGTSSAVSEGGPALRIRQMRPPSLPVDAVPGTLDVTLLGLTIVLGGQYFNWNATFAAGLLPATTAFLLVGGAYVVLLFSLAEVASVLPFSGGAYALTRKTLGYFVGFMVGAIDVLEFVLYVSASVLTLAKIVVTGEPRLRGLEPVVWALFFVSATALQSRSHVIFWRASALLATGSVVVLLVFCLGSASHCDIRKHTVSSMDITTRKPLASPKLSDMMRVLPFCGWFYVGSDALVFISDHIAEPRVVVPTAQRLCILLCVATAVLTFFIAVSLPPGISSMADAELPLSPGFMAFTRLSEAQAAWLSLPATYATAFGFMWGYGRLITSLAASGLVPRWLAAHIQQQVRQNRGLSSRAAVGVGSALSFAVCLLVHYVPGDPLVLTRFCIGLAFLSYTAQTLAFIALRQSVSSSRGHALAQSTARSPFGVWGAYAALLVWVLGFLSVVGFQDSAFVELVSIVSVLLLLALYYYVSVRHHELLSNDERGVVLAAATKPPSRPPSQPDTALARAPSPAVAPKEPPRSPSTTSDADGSFTRPSRTSSGSLRMPQLVRSGSKLNELAEELTDDTEEPFVPNWPPSQPDHREPPAAALPTPLRRGGSDSLLASITSTQPAESSAPPLLRRDSRSSFGWSRSFLARNGRLERLREETDRDLRSALSGIWSERSARWSRGRAS